MESCLSMSKMAEQPSTRDMLLQRKEHLERQLADIEAAISALDRNPEFEELHNLLSRISY